MASLYLQYTITRVMPWEEVRQAGGVDAFQSFTSIGGVSIKTSFLSSHTDGYHLNELVGMSYKAPTSTETGVSWAPAGTTYWTSSPIMVPDDAPIPIEYLRDPVGGGGGTGNPDGDFGVVRADENGVPSFDWTNALFDTGRSVFASGLKSGIETGVGAVLAPQLGPQFTASVLNVAEVGFRLDNLVDTATEAFAFTMANFDTLSAAEIDRMVSSVLLNANNEFSTGFASIATRSGAAYSALYYKAVANGLAITLNNFDPGDPASRYSVNISERLYYNSEGSDIIFIPEGGRELFGGLGDDIVIAGGANNSFLDGGGSDRYVAGAGLNEVIFAETRGEVSATIDASGEIIIERAGGDVDRMVGISRLKFADGTLALDIAGAAGQTYRLYQAAFDREPDFLGLSFNVDKMDGGWSLLDMANVFVGSDEFLEFYGSPSNEQLVQLLYSNILGRAGEPAGIAFWLDQLSNGMAAAELLMHFSESPENVLLVEPQITNGIWLL